MGRQESKYNYNTMSNTSKTLNFDIEMNDVPNSGVVRRETYLERYQREYLAFVSDSEEVWKDEVDRIMRSDREELKREVEKKHKRLEWEQVRREILNEEKKRKGKCLIMEDKEGCNQE